MEKKIIIATSGTGGHTIPSIVLAKELVKNGYRVKIIINKGGIGIELIKREELEIFPIDFHGFPRRVSLNFFLFFFRLLVVCFKIHRLLNKEKPDLILGMGGFVSFPVSFVGWIKKIPVLIHEQNTKIGLSNLVSALFAKRLLLGLPLQPPRWLRRKTKLVGIPIRRELFSYRKDESAERFGFKKNNITVLVFGGSQGATKLNEIVPKLISSLPTDIQIIHITGKRDYEKVKKMYASTNRKYVVFDFLNEMGLAYAAADLVISRAGALTVFELIQLKKPAILIPYPYSTAQHQHSNAEILAKLEAGIIIDEEMIESLLLSEIKKLLNKEKLRELAKNYQKLSLPDTYSSFKREVEIWIKKKN